MKNITFEEAIKNVANSIIKEQEELTLLLDAEALKVNKFIDLEANASELLQVNNAMTEMVNEVNIFDTALKNKLALITKYLD